MKRTLLLSLFSLMLFAESKKLLNPEYLQGEKSKKEPKLYSQVEDAVAQPKTETLSPNRVYGVYVEARNGWMFSLTNSHGNFAEPMEVLYPGSVLPGKFIGAKNPLDRFKLNKDWKWEQTAEKERHLLYILSVPPALKKITFFIPQKQ